MTDVSKAKSKPARTRSQRAGLVFPVARIQNTFKKKIGGSIGGSAAIYGYVFFILKNRSPRMY